MKRQYSEVDPDGANIEAAPYSQLGRVTHTARMDSFSVAERLALGSAGTYYAQARVEPQMFDALMPDLLLQRAGKTEEFKQGGRTGFYSIVFSSMNALRENPRLPKHKVIEKYRLAGVTQGGVKYHGDKPNSEFVAVTTGGSHTIINNGKEHIRAGDELWWDIPDRIALGQPNAGQATGYTPRRDDPPGKIPAVVVKPYRPDVHGPTSLQQLISQNQIDSSVLTDRSKLDEGGHLSELFDCMVRIMALGAALGPAAAGNPAGAVALVNNAAYRQAVLGFLLTSKQSGGPAAFMALYGNLYSDTVNCFQAHAANITGRKFAKATSNAAPGKPVDVVLGTYRLS